MAAWVIGARATLKALLLALLEPLEKLRTWEAEGNYTRRLACLEELKSMPAGAVWDYFCLVRDVPIGMEWVETIAEYERRVLRNR